MSYSFDREDQCFIPATQEELKKNGRYQTLTEVRAIDINQKAGEEIIKIINEFEPRK